MKDETKGKIVDIFETSKEKTSELIDKGAEYFDDAKDKVQEYKEKVKESDFYDKAEDKTKEFINKSKDFTKDKKEKLEAIIKNAKEDENFKENLKKEPTKTIEDLFGVDLPDEELKELASTVKSKIDLDKIEDFFDDTKNKIKNLFK